MVTEPLYVTCRWLHYHFNCYILCKARLHLKSSTPSPWKVIWINLIFHVRFYNTFFFLFCMIRLNSYGTSNAMETTLTDVTDLQGLFILLKAITTIVYAKMSLLNLNCKHLIVLCFVSITDLTSNTYSLHSTTWHRVMPVNVSALMVNRAVTFYTSGGPEHPKQDIHTFRKK